jgi:hypothetical protein
MATIIFNTTQISGLSHATYPSAAARKKYVDNISSNALSKFYSSSLGHFYTGSGTKLHSAYVSTSTGIFAIASHTHAASDVAWSGAYQFTAVSSMVKTLDTWYDISSSKLSRAYVSTSTGKFEPKLTKGTLTATSPIVLSDSTRQLIGGAAAISISNYIGSTQAIARFPNSSNVRARFVASSLSLTRYNQYVGHSGNTNVHTTASDKAKWNNIANSGVKYTWTYKSVLDSGLKWYAAYKHSANSSLHSFSVTNYITSTNAIRRFTDSSNVRFRFQASSLSYQSYKHSSNKFVHTLPITFNVANVQISANTNLNLARFNTGQGKTCYLWQASCCGSGGASIGNLKVQLLSGSTNKYWTSSATIQQGYPLVSCEGKIEIRMMYSGSTSLTGEKYGTAFMNVSVQ